jgi:hypothetical protein
MRKTLFDMTHLERVAYFRDHPPQAGSNQDAYDRGIRGFPNLIFPRGSVSASAYRAGRLNRSQA